MPHSHHCGSSKLQTCSSTWYGGRVHVWRCRGALLTMLLNSSHACVGTWGRDTLLPSHLQPYTGAMLHAFAGTEGRPTQRHRPAPACAAKPCTAEICGPGCLPVVAPDTAAKCWAAAHGLPILEARHHQPIAYASATRHLAAVSGPRADKRHGLQVFALHCQS